MSSAAAAGGSVGEALVGLLAEHGVERVFGIPGVHTLELFRGITAHGLSHTLNRHEQGAVFAADGYARVTGRPGVAFVISGPGLTNAATAIAQAHHDSIPLLVIAAVARARGARAGANLHDLPDQLALAAAITGRARTIRAAAELPAALADAFSLLGSERPRPVYLELPVSLLCAPSPPLAALPVVAARPSAPAAALDRAARLLASSERPLILAGGGTQGAATEVVALAERLDAPVATTLNGKGVIAATHPLSLGAALTSRTLLDELRDADVVLAAGTEFCTTDYYYAGLPEFGGAVIRVDIDAAELDRHVAPAVALHGDAALSLTGLTRRLDPAARDGRRRAARLRSAMTWWPQADGLRTVLDAIGEALPADVIVAVDSCQLGYAGQTLWPAERPRSWLVPHGFGTLGPALPMAAGAALGAPGRPVVVVVGDGGLQFTLEELATIAAERLPVCVLLWDNDGYGEMRDEMRTAGIVPVATDVPVADWPSLVRGFGCAYDEPRSLGELSTMLADATAAGSGPAVLRLRPDLLSVAA